jgi:hypothetical protein
MTTTITPMLLAATFAIAGGFSTSDASAQEAAQFRVDCWIGAKFGVTPGQLVRGWICERPFIPEAARDRHLAPGDPQRQPTGREDVAKIDAGTGGR